MTVGERIKEIRELRGLSQVECAEKIGITKQSLYKYENNIVTNIPIDKVEALSKVLHISPAYLMGWADDQDYIKNISDDEYLLVKAFRKAPEYMQQAICDMLHIKRGDASSYNSKVG